MPKHSPFLAVLAALAMPLIFGTPAAFAQSTTAEEPAQETPATPDDGLSLGDEADAETQVGQPYDNEQIGPWTMRCIKSEDGDDPCQMYQLLKDDSGAPVAEFSLFRLPEGGRASAGAVIIVPLETSLADQLSIQVDAGQSKRYPYSFCNSIGCYARIGLTPEDITAYKRGNEATLTIVPVVAPDEKVTVKLSLEGFTASFDKTTTAQ